MRPMGCAGSRVARLKSVSPRVVATLRSVSERWGSGYTWLFMQGSFGA